MTKEEFIKERCELEDITEEEFEKDYRVVECNCGEPYCRGYRCLNIDSLLLENQQLKQWDANKDTRNSRQRVANAKLIKENQKLKEVIDKLELENKVLKEQMVAMVKPNYTFGVRWR